MIVNNNNTISSFDLSSSSSSSSSYSSSSSFVQFEKLPNVLQEYVKSFSDMETYLSIKLVSKNLKNSFNEQTLSVNTKINRIYLSNRLQVLQETEDSLIKSIKSGVMTQNPLISASSADRIVTIIRNAPATKKTIKESLSLTSNALEAREIYCLVKIFSSTVGRSAMAKLANAMTQLPVLMHAYAENISQDFYVMASIDRILEDDRNARFVASTATASAASASAVSATPLVEANNQDEELVA